MSEEINNAPVEGTAVPEATEAPAPPAPGTAEYNAQMIARSGNVPAKFVDQATGEVNMEAFVQSYAALEQKMSQGETPAASAEPVSEAPAVEEAPVAEAAPVIDELAVRDPEPEPVEEAPAEGEAPSGVSPQEWTDWKMEIMRQGDLTPETKELVKQRLGLPDEIVADYIDAQRAQMRAGFSKAADVVGGQESLSKIFGWASNNLDAGAREVINAGLASPAWETTLRGLESQYNSAQAARPKAAEMSHQAQASSPAGVESVKGFSSTAEFNTFRSDPKYGKDRRFTQMVNGRAAMTNWRNMS